MTELNTRKKLLVIGAGDFQLPLVQKASETCDVLLAAPVISGAFDPYITDRLLTDVRDEEAILAFAKDRGIDGVITDQTDIAVRSVAYVAEKMGLPGIGCDTGVLFTDKSLMRTRLAELGIPQLKNRTVSSVDEAVGFYRELCRERQESRARSDTAKVPEAAYQAGDNTADAAKAEAASAVPPVKVIIKPLDTQGSRGVQVCADEQQIRDKYDEASRWSSSRQVIVEQLDRKSVV